MTTPLNPTPNQNPSTIKAPPQKRRRSSGLLNIVLLVVILGLVFFVVRAEQEKRAASTKLTQTTNQLVQLKESTKQSGQKIADDILAKVRRHIDLPTDPQPTVATITDVEKLRATNDFYKKAENGNYLIVTTARAILYDDKRDLILDVVPVKIDKTATSSTTPTLPETSVTPSPSSTPAPTSIYVGP